MSKPFDLKAALAGALVEIKGGRPVTQLHLFDKLEPRLYGMCAGMLWAWGSDGCIITAGGDPSNNLQMVTVKKKYYFNVWSRVRTWGYSGKPELYFFIGNTFDNEDQAKLDAKLGGSVNTKPKKFVQTITIENEE